MVSSLKSPKCASAQSADVLTVRFGGTFGGERLPKRLKRLRRAKRLAGRVGELSALLAVRGA